MKFKPRFLMGFTILAVLLPMFPPIIAAQETAAHKLSAMDEFQLQTEIGRGTRVAVKKWVP